MSTAKNRRTAPRRQTVSDELRRIIRSRGTPCAVARAADVAPSVLTRFVNGDRGLTSDTLDRVADALGLELRETRRGARGRGRNPVPIDMDRRDDETPCPAPDPGEARSRPGPGAGQG